MISGSQDECGKMPWKYELSGSETSLPTHIAHTSSVIRLSYSKTSVSTQFSLFINNIIHKKRSESLSFLNENQTHTAYHTAFCIQCLYMSVFLCKMHFDQSAALIWDGGRGLAAWTKSIRCLYRRLVTYIVSHHILLRMNTQIVLMVMYWIS